MISKEQYPRKVLTNRGVLDIHDVLPGDFVYEWRTGNPLEVKTIKMIPYRNMYKVTYNDGRIEYHTDIEPAYLDEWILPLHHPFCECMKTNDYPIKLWPIHFNNGSVTRPLNPDPYVAAALLIYGDQNDPYLNYPLDRTEANNAFSHKYNVTYFPQTGKNKAYFQWKGMGTDHRITWNEFFSGYSFYAKTHNPKDLPVPKEYLYASYKDRRQFIRGIFDMGYVQDRSPDTVAAFHKDEDMLKIVQQILWSMGISSNISYDDSGTDNRVWRLDVMAPLHTHPGFFYHQPYIENMMNLNRASCNKDLVSTVTIVEAVSLQNCSEMIHNPVPHIILERPHMIYTSPNFLPRVSI